MWGGLSLCGEELKRPEGAGRRAAAFCPVSKDAKTPSGHVPLEVFQLGPSTIQHDVHLIQYCPIMSQTEHECFRAGLLGSTKSRVQRESNVKRQNMGNIATVKASGGQRLLRVNSPTGRRAEPERSYFSSSLETHRGSQRRGTSETTMPRMLPRISGG